MHALPFEPIDLAAVDAARNIRHRWSVIAQRDLFGHVIVQTCWGRIGSGGRTLVQSFGDDAAAARYVRGLLARRATARRRIGVDYVLLPGAAAGSPPARLPASPRGGTAPRDVQGEAIMTGDVLAFAGSLIGAAAAVGGAVWVEHYKRGLEAREYRQLLRDALQAFEQALAASSEQEKRWREGRPDLGASKASILEILASIEEADDLLEDASRAARGSYTQRRTLYRLGKALARNEDAFRSEAEAVGKMNVTPTVLAIHFEKVGPAAREVGAAVAAAREAWKD